MLLIFHKAIRFSVYGFQAEEMGTLDLRDKGCTEEPPMPTHARFATGSTSKCLRHAFGQPVEFYAVI